MTMRVEDLMVRDVAKVRPEDDLRRAASLMDRKKCGSVAVVDEAGKAVGVLTDRDICMAAMRTNSPLSSTKVRKAMSRPLHSCRPDHSLAEAERRMGQHQVRRLVVLDAAGNLTGILCLDDIAREAFQGMDLVAAPVSAEAVGWTLGQIGRPHLIGNV